MIFDPSKVMHQNLIQFDPNLIHQNRIWISNGAQMLYSNVNPLFHRPRAGISANHLEISKNQWKIDIRAEKMIRKCHR